MCTRNFGTLLISIASAWNFATRATASWSSACEKPWMREFFFSFRRKSSKQPRHDIYGTVEDDFGLLGRKDIRVRLSLAIAIF